MLKMREWEKWIPFIMGSAVISESKPQPSFPWQSGILLRTSGRHAWPVFARLDLKGVPGNNPSTSHGSPSEMGQTTGGMNIDIWFSGVGLVE
jgi:hypothetical protein